MHAHYQLITSGLKQFSGKTISTWRFIVFKTYNRYFDLLMARRRNVHVVIIGRIRTNISQSGIGVVIALKQSRELFPSFFAGNALDL